MRIQSSRMTTEVFATASHCHEKQEISLRLHPPSDEASTQRDVVLVMDEAEFHDICLMLSKQRLDMRKEHQEACWRAQLASESTLNQAGKQMNSKCAHKSIQTLGHESNGDEINWCNYCGAAGRAGNLATPDHSEGEDCEHRMRVCYSTGTKAADAVDWCISCGLAFAHGHDNSGARVFTATYVPANLPPEQHL